MGETEARKRRASERAKVKRPLCSASSLFRTASTTTPTLVFPFASTSQYPHTLVFDTLHSFNRVSYQHSHGQQGGAPGRGLERLHAGSAVLCRSRG
jgi:hypothetical protein